MSDPNNNNVGKEQGTRPQKGKPRYRELTLKDLKDEIKRNPASFLASQTPSSKSKYKRTRKRVENPKQTYLYASQRLKLQQQQQEQEQQNNPLATTATQPENAKLAKVREVENVAVILARQLGMISWQQHCDADMLSGIQPKLMGIIRVGDDVDATNSDDSAEQRHQQQDGARDSKQYLDSVAFIIDKPAGWSISGSKTPSRLHAVLTEATQNQADKEAIDETVDFSKTMVTSSESFSKREPEYDEMDLLAVMTPQEAAEYQAARKISMQGTPNFDRMDFYDGGNSESSLVANDNDIIDQIDENREDYDEVAVTTIQEQSENQTELTKDKATGTMNAEEGGRYISEQTSLNLRKIAARTSSGRILERKEAMFANPSRPSVMSWLRELQAQRGKPIRGSKYWQAVAGATDVDDSGLVLLCTKAKVSNLFVDYTDYIVVLGNGGQVAPKTNEPPIKGIVGTEIVSKLKRGRLDDIVTTVKLTVQETSSTCSAAVQACQSEFGDGVRGDPDANPLDRRAPRRLVHCNAMTVSSLVLDDEFAQVQTETWPDDIAVFANRKQHAFIRGSFMGRSELRANPHTTAYREINSDGDGFPGWTVDRYGKWLLVQHESSQLRGPLPSIHDGNTAGVYCKSFGSNRYSNSHPNQVRLMEGQAAPEIIAVLEHGVTYHVSLEQQEQSTMFLDQRPLRAWLSQHCCNETRVLSCFAGQGGGTLSVAAAVAGASTVSLDFNKKSLDCIPSQLAANGIDYDERHDCIFGDCLEWMTRLNKRGEKFDLVILDPPNSFIDKNMKRWNVKTDMEELVTLAAPLVKPNGYLWTLTRNAAIPVQKYVKMCERGFANVPVSSKLERIQPMPLDFPTIGTPPAKFVMWRIRR